jgi:hypothetical protein
LPSRPGRRTRRIASAGQAFAFAAGGGEERLRDGGRVDAVEAAGVQGGEVPLRRLDAVHAAVPASEVPAEQDPVRDRSFFDLRNQPHLSLTLRVAEHVELPRVA